MAIKSRRQDSFSALVHLITLDIAIAWCEDQRSSLCTDLMDSRSQKLESRQSDENGVFSTYKHSGLHGARQSWLQLALGRTRDDRKLLGECNADGAHASCRRPSLFAPGSMCPCGPLSTLFSLASDNNARAPDSLRTAESRTQGTQ
eukprot:3499865-Pleurochrysis_carterae.AAC.1